MWWVGLIGLIASSYMLGVVSGIKRFKITAKNWPFHFFGGCAIAACVDLILRHQ
jgi:hypothetical protein